MFILIPIFLLCIITILLVCRKVLGDGDKILDIKPINFIKMDVNVENNAKYTAIIIEPRPHKALEFVLNNFLENLSSDWNIIVFHGNRNMDFVNDIVNIKLNKYITRIKLINLNIDDLSIQEYSHIFYNPDFYNLIPTEIFLVFQTDTIICSKYKDLIYDFIKYDYVGAPWTSIFDNKGSNVGNGGLSLRKKSKSIEILDKCNLESECYKTILCDSEDLIMSKTHLNNCSSINIYKPSNDEAKNFAIETVKNDKSFGIHKPWKYINIDYMKDWCPDVFTLKKLNK